MDKCLIKVSGWTKKQLEKIKKKQGHTSLDSVIKTLLLKNGELYGKKI